MKPPTEAQLRKARRKALVERLFEAWHKDGQRDPEFNVYSEMYAQRCPYTCVLVHIGRGRGNVGSSFGFSKCKWPDVFDAQYGIDLAVKKAIAYIVKEHGLAD
jgi:hypothetical protein